LDDTTSYSKFGSIAETIKQLISTYGVYGYGKNTPGRKEIKPHDRICIYEVGKGIVSHGTVATYPKNQIHPALDYEKFPWVFEIEDSRLYLDDPVELTPELRKQLDAFKDKNIENWSWFVQSTRKLTKKDFKLLINQKSQSNPENLNSYF